MGFPVMNHTSGPETATKESACPAPSGGGAGQATAGEKVREDLRRHPHVCRRHDQPLVIPGISGLGPVVNLVFTRSCDPVSGRQFFLYLVYVFSWPKVSGPNRRNLAGTLTAR